MEDASAGSKLYCFKTYLKITSGISSLSLFCWEVGQKGMQMTMNWAWHGSPCWWAPGSLSLCPCLCLLTDRSSGQSCDHQARAPQDGCPTFPMTCPWMMQFYANILFRVAPGQCRVPCHPLTCCPLGNRQCIPGPGDPKETYC